jgi:AcrR family transcriptional regulator
MDMPMDTRKKILESGLKLFSEKGYLGATTKEIAKKAGVAELTLFRHFTSKEKLFEEMINTYSFLPALKELLPELKGLGYREALSEIAKRFLGRLIERRHLIRIMQAEIELYPSQVREVYNRLFGEIVKTLASYFAELQAKGMLRDFDPELGARAFLGMFYSYFNTQELTISRKRRFSNRENIVDEYVGIFVGGTVSNGRRLEE